MAARYLRAGAVEQLSSGERRGYGGPTEKLPRPVQFLCCAPDKAVDGAR
jgi:hypothetical protein